MKDILVIFLLLVTVGTGQILTPDEISAQIEAQKNSSDQENSPAVVAVLEEAKALSEQLNTVNAEAASFQAKESQGRMPELEDVPVPAAGAPLEELNQSLVEVSAALERSRTQLSQARSDFDGVEMRKQELLRLLADAREKLAGIPNQPEGENELAKAQGERSLLQSALLEASVKKYEAEEAFLETEQDDLPERIRVLKEHAEGLASRQTKLQTVVAQLSKEEAEQTEVELASSSETFANIPELMELVEEIRQLNKQRTSEGGVQAEIKEATSYDKRMRRLVTKIQNQEKDAKEKIELLESVGLDIDADTGIVLREQRAELPRIIELERELRQQIEVAVRSQVTRIDLGDKKNINPPLSKKVVSRILKENPSLKEEEITNLFEQRNTLLTTLISEHDVLQARLEGANEDAQLAINAIKSYSVFLDQRLLWTRSTTPIQANEPRSELGNIRRLFSAEMLERAGVSVRENWFSRLLPALVLMLLFLFGVIRRGPLRGHEKEASEKAAKRNCTSIRPTVITIVSSVLIAVTIPALFFLVALLISDPMAYRLGFLNAGLFLFVASLLYRFSKPATLFESHFKFSPVKTKRIRNTLRAFIPILLPLAFGIGALAQNGEFGTSGRLVFVGTMVIVIMVAHRLFHPKHSIIGNPEKPTILSRATYVLAIAVPLSFLIGASLGYFSSVLTLRAQVLATAGILLGAFLVINFFTRWILVSRRRLAIQQALQKREAALAERERKKKAELENEPEVQSPEEVKAQAVNVVEVGQQTSQLVRYGVYFSVFFAIFSIWSTSLTALSVLDEKPLWPGSKKQAVETTAGGSTASSNTGAMPSLMPPMSSQAAETAPEAVATVLAPPNDFVSWQDLLLSLFVFLLTFVAARNIPGLLSLAVFSRLNLGPGGNFAFTTMVRYFIVFTGVVIGLNKVGITWDKVQWLAAAITLGIGFGLQEIFANFVAGLILLFERPIRLGDIVTVGDVSGKVTEIKIRATTIQQFNNRDLLVPNKDFITNQLTNWTLKDSVLRFDLSVGIAYGSDTRKAEEILKRILKEHPLVLDEPAPQVIFETFGDSTLNFLLRAHVGQVGNLVKTQSDLHYQIDDAFRKAEIEIAFPQQDIHVRSLPDGVALEPVGAKSE